MVYLVVMRVCRRRERDGVSFFVFLFLTLKSLGVGRGAAYGCGSSGEEEGGVLEP